MSLLRPLVRFFVRQLFTQLSLSCWYITTHPATQTLLKQIYSLPSAWRRPRRFFKSISWITLSSAGVSSVSRKQDFCYRGPLLWCALQNFSAGRQKVAISKYRTNSKMIPWPTYPLQIVSTRRALVVWCDFPAIHGRPGDGILHIRFVPNVFAAQNVLV